MTSIVYVPSTLDVHYEKVFTLICMHYSQRTCNRINYTLSLVAVQIVWFFGRARPMSRSIYIESMTCIHQGTNQEPASTVSGVY